MRLGFGAHRRAIAPRHGRSNGKLFRDAQIRAHPGAYPVHGGQPRRGAAAKPGDERRIVQRVVAQPMRLAPGDGDKRVRRFHLTPEPRAEGRFAHERQHPVRRIQPRRAAVLEPVACEAPIAKRDVPEAPRAHSLALAVHHDQVAQRAIEGDLEETVRKRVDPCAPCCHGAKNRRAAIAYQYIFIGVFQRAGDNRRHIPPSLRTATLGYEKKCAGRLAIHARIALICATGTTSNRPTVRFPGRQRAFGQTGRVRAGVQPAPAAADRRQPGLCSLHLPRPRRPCRRHGAVEDSAGFTGLIDRLDPALRNDRSHA